MAATELGSGGPGEAAAKPPTAEEEVLKRNTDCVYFLASPLTCKKGSECEFRHSEGARVNPRDCWFWMNGNCLNPKCSFRHPPLDGLYGPPGAVLPSAEFPASYAQGYNNANKQKVPCYYFQKGGCLKGDKCPFMHGPQPAGDPALQTNGNLVSPQEVKVPTSSSEQQQAPKNSSWKFQAWNSHQPKVNFGQPSEVPLQPTVMPAVSTEVLSNNGFRQNKDLLRQPIELELPRSQPTVVPSGASDPSRIPHDRQLGHMDEHVQNGHETEEFLPESSPGFDVLADGDAEDPNYVSDEEEYGRGSMQGGRTRNLSDDFDYGRIPQFEKDQFNNEFDDYDRNVRSNSNDWKKQRRSSDRVPDRPAILHREKFTKEMDRSDLRHRLKQRRLDNPRSAVSQDRRRDPYRREDRYAEERCRGQTSSRGLQDYPHVGSISSRLRGRIKLPRRSPPGSVDLQFERERDRGTYRGRRSPARQISNNSEARSLDRLRRSKPLEEPARENTRDRGEGLEFVDFAGPKSLAELKGAKTSASSQDQKPKELRNMKPLKSVVGHQERKESFSFEGPKPLSAILKRKRETTPGSSAISGSEDENQKRGSDIQQHLFESDKADNYDEEGLIHSGGEEEHNYEQHSPAKEAIPEADEDEDLDLENYEQRDGDYYYEIAEGGDFRAEDDGEEYDDDDDFAKKVGMMLS